MKERLKLIQEILNCCEGIALLAGIMVWWFITDKRVKAFVLYLLFIVIGELLGWYFRKQKLTGDNMILYNYFVIPVEFLFSYWFLYSYMPSKMTQKICIAFSAISILSRVFELKFLKDERLFFSSLSYVISSLLLLILILFFLWQFIKSDKLLHYDRHFDFWVTIALLIYYLGCFPLWTFYNYLYNTSKESFYVYWQIQMYLNMLMYLLFATALLWTNIKYRSS